MEEKQNHKVMFDAFAFKSINIEKENDESFENTTKYKFVSRTYFDAIVRKLDDKIVKAKLIGCSRYISGVYDSSKNGWMDTIRIHDMEPRTYIILPYEKPLAKIFTGSIKEVNIKEFIKIMFKRIFWHKYILITKYKDLVSKDFAYNVAAVVSKSKIIF